VVEPMTDPTTEAGRALLAEAEEQGIFASLMDRYWFEQTVLAIEAQARAAGAVAGQKVCEAKTVEKAWGAFLSAADAVHADLPPDLLPEFALRLDTILDAPAEEES